MDQNSETKKSTSQLWASEKSHQFELNQRHGTAECNKAVRIQWRKRKTVKPIQPRGGGETTSALYRLDCKAQGHHLVRFGPSAICGVCSMFYTEPRSLIGSPLKRTRFGCIRPRTILTCLNKARKKHVTYYSSVYQAR